MSDIDDAGLDLDTGSSDADTFDPSPDGDIDAAGDDSLGELHGAPESSSDEWFLQYDDGYCVPPILVSRAPTITDTAAITNRRPIDISKIGQGVTQAPTPRPRMMVPVTTDRHAHRPSAEALP